MNVQSLLLALCLWIVPSVAHATPAKECFQSQHLLRQVHKTEHIYWNKAKTCYHIGYWGHAKTSVASKPSPPKAGSGSLVKDNLTWVVHAKPADPFTFRFIEREITRWRYGFIP